MEEVRTCPTCGKQTHRLYCADDGWLTIAVERPIQDLREYRTDDVIGDRYRIIEPLGKGVATIVFDAEHVGTGQRVAIKAFTVDPKTDEGMVSVQRFFREARICSSLQHPNTVRVFDVGQDERGALFIAMERLTGETLAKVMQRKIVADETLSQGETVTIGIAVANALMGAHELGLVHRDLNPANIMLGLDPDGQQVVKVLDFGVARIENSVLTRAGQLPGAPRYMSPEQCRNRKIDGRSDLYSLGCLLYACVAGRAPFEGREPLTIMQKHVMEAPPDVHEWSKSRLSDRFVAILEKALQKDPAERFQSATEMHEALSQLNVNPRRAKHRVDSGAADPARQSKMLATMAQQTSDPARAYEYAKTAMKLDPRNLEARRIARMTLASLRKASGAVPVIPPPPGGSADISKKPLNKGD